MKNFLVIRFSSIGDIVLTTPIIRCLKKQYPDANIHFITKAQFKGVLASNPHISKIITVKKEVSEVANELKAVQYDFVIDLHKNIRSRQVINITKSPSAAFSKLNYKKWLLTNFKINKMPNVHIVDRYFETVKSLNVQNDNLGLDFTIAPQNVVSDLPFTNYATIVVGAAHATKAMTAQKMGDVVQAAQMPIVLVGGPNDVLKAQEVIDLAKGCQVFNACGKYNLEQSASILQQSKAVITPDTGLMHIASALGKKVISVWGNTVPDFGMYPYIPQNPNQVKIVQVNNLSCRPCSKIGHPKCPKKHFKCIVDLDVQEIVGTIL